MEDRVRFQRLGAIALGTGIVLLILNTIQSQTSIDWLPFVWHTNRTIWWIFSIGSLLGGAWLLATYREDDPQPESRFTDHSPLTILTTAVRKTENEEEGDEFFEDSVIVRRRP